jgi:Zn-dependent protease/CBS domain-containing protein
MRRFRVGSAFGIPLQVDLTFLLVLPLFAWLIGTGVEQTVPVLNRLPAANVAVEPLATSPTRWLLGLAAAVGLFVGIVLHELGHSVVARAFGFPIESITLWLFGGIAQLTDLPEDWKQELAIALAGPVVSVALGLAIYVPFAALPPEGHAVRFVLGYLAVLNVALAVFNMLPAFPMDGGRVLRAVLGLWYPYARATQLAAEVGKLFAILFGLAGLLGGNIILIGVAFFVYVGASGEAQQVTIRAAFEGVAVRDIMTPRSELDTVAPTDSVAALFERMFRERHTGYPVVDGGHLAGMVTLSDAEDVPTVEREAFTVADVMTDDVVTVDVDAPVTDALDRMRDHGVGRLAVVADDDLAGIISRSDVMRALDVVKTAGADVSDRVSSARSGPRRGA